MPDVTTPVLGLTKPGINESKDTWGTKWNVNADKLDTDAGDTDAKILALQNRCAALEAEAGKASWVGEVRMHSGTLASIDAIPGGVWKLCDGTNGTPNLTDRFIICAHPGRVPGSTGGNFQSTGTVDGAGAHSHGGRTQDHVLTWNEMPSHGHGVNDPGHAHGYLDRVNNGDWEAGVNGTNPGGSDIGRGTDPAGTGISIQSSGGDWGHHHLMWEDGTHQHTLTMWTVPPYYALALVMRTA